MDSRFVAERPGEGRAIRNLQVVGRSAGMPRRDQRIKTAFAPPIGERAIRTRAAEEKETASEAFTVDAHDRIDRGAWIEPLPCAAAPQNEGLPLYVADVYRVRPKRDFDHRFSRIQLA